MFHQGCPACVAQVAEQEIPGDAGPPRRSGAGSVGIPENSPPHGVPSFSATFIYKFSSHRCQSDKWDWEYFQNQRWMICQGDRIITYIRPFHQEKKPVEGEGKKKQKIYLSSGEWREVFGAMGINVTY